VAFTIGILLSIRADRRDPHYEERRRERTGSMRQGGDEAAEAEGEAERPEPAASHRGR
jgi:hypothetical protein